MNKIFYKKLDKDGFPTGNLFSVRDEESAEGFRVVYQPQADKWIVLFALKIPGRRGSSMCQVFTKRGAFKQFSLSSAYKLVKVDTNESHFSVIFDPELLMKQIAFTRDS